MSKGFLRRDRLPVPRLFYAKELGGKLTRPSRGWCKARCPFHNSQSGTSFSINVDTGGFHCFGCGKSGDIISFIMLLYKLSFQEAAQSLGAWDSNGITSAADIHKAKMEREQRQAERQANEELQRRQRIEAAEWLHVLERIYIQTKNRLTELRRGGPEKFAGEIEQCWELLANTLPQIRTARGEYSQLAGLAECL